MSEEDKLIWKRDYVQPLFDKYKEIPTKVKYALIEKDYIRMYGKKFTEDKMRYMYDDSEDANAMKVAQIRMLNANINGYILGLPSTAAIAFGNQLHYINP